MELVTLHSSEKDYYIGFGESRIGGRSENQDTFGAQKTKRGFVVTVCDGMGGGPGGKTASSIAVHEIIACINDASDEEECANILIKAVRCANMAIIKAGNEHPSLHGMGCTATVLLLTPMAAYVAHVGDSRIYQIRGHKKVFRTFDHSMVFDLVRQGVITEEQARLSAQSNVITRALGIKPDVEVDVEELPYENGDRFLLCTDGIHGTMPEPELLRKVSSRRNALGAVVDDVATFVDNTGRESGNSHDNLTLAVIEVKRDSKKRPKMTKFAKKLLLALFVVAAASITLNLFLYQRTSVVAGDSQSLLDGLQRRDSAWQDSVKSLQSSIDAMETHMKKYGQVWDEWKKQELEKQK